MDNEQMELSTRNFTSRSWTSGEITLLKDNAHLGADAVALMLGRSVKSVKSAANRLRISLRPAGSKRGLILGQPRDVSWVDQGAGIANTRLNAIRDDVLAGVSDMAALEARAREIALGDNERPVCPACGARPQERKSTGLCEVCHLRALAQAHRDDEAKRDAQRELWRARQEASRTRRSKQQELDIESE